MRERDKSEKPSDCKGKRPLPDVTENQPDEGSYSTSMGQKPRDLGHRAHDDGRGDVPETPGNGTGWNMDAGRTDGADDDSTGRDRESPDLDDQRELRLLAVLGDLVERHSQGEAAELLGISRKTIWRGTTSGRLTPHLASALEQWLVEADRAAHTALEERTTDLERLVAQWGEALQTGLGALRSDFEGLREAVNRGDAGQAQAKPSPVVRSTGAGTSSRESRNLPWRPYPQLVTSEPEPGEERFYGEATPTVVAWREARRESREGRRRLERLDAELRMRELELVLIGDHELTLPPAVYPWDRADRRNELWRRRQALADASAERRQAVMLRWLRRLLTLGLWWR